MWSKVGVYIVVLSQVFTHPRDQFLLYDFRFLAGKLGDFILVVKDFPPDDFMDPGLVDIQFTRANCYRTKFLWAEFAGVDFLEANMDAAMFDEDVDWKKLS